MSLTATNTCDTALFLTNGVDVRYGPKADMKGRISDVRFIPEADVLTSAKCQKRTHAPQQKGLFDQIIGKGQQ